MKPPEFVNDALGSLGLAGEFRCSNVAAGRAEAWAYVINGDRALRLWTELQHRAPPDWWPLIVGDESSECRLGDIADTCQATVRELVAEASGLAGEKCFHRWAERHSELAILAGIRDEMEIDPAQVAEELAEHRDSWDGIVLARDPHTKAPRSTVLVVLRTNGEQATVPAILGWGGGNDCPRPVEQVAVLRYWHEQYGAVIAGLSADMFIELRPSRRPADVNGAIALALQQCLYCPEIRSVGPLAPFAAALMRDSDWVFWWD